MPKLSKDNFFGRPLPAIKHQQRPIWKVYNCETGKRCHPKNLTLSQARDWLPVGSFCFRSQSNRLTSEY
jgi:hypothetical protein